LGLAALEQPGRARASEAPFVESRMKKILARALLRRRRAHPRDRQGAVLALLFGVGMHAD
jgi:hypothetical protein